MTELNYVYGIEQFGDVDQIVARQIVEKALEEQGVRIEVLASSVNPIDIKTRKGLGFVAAQKPVNDFMGLGYDVYGRIKALGSQVKNFAVGQYVIGMVGFAHHPGCYAKQVDAHVSEIIPLAQKENSAIAGLCLSGLTAYQALQCVPVSLDIPIYINAPTGGVGHLAVQLAKLEGRKVIALSSRPNHELLAKLDVEVMDYDSFFDTPRTGQLLDLVGGDRTIELLDNLTAGSEVVTVPTISKEQVCEHAKRKQINAQGMVVEANCDDLNKLYRAVRSGKLTVHMDKQFVLPEVADAHRYMEKGEHSGKVIILA
ncbi:NADP-dependent oxidoreductase [Pseudoalteromonas sp. MMG022]|uniref:NADP-dependent oxidoreductase n=1 Tax=Pseudoalteromonas sp. MMG022 TaxID=2909978 RepID=UPI001F4043E1|nr:NADP-dependent oxidoreductase [Pseudoalteromonas sp. MMG022]MCF6436333.1 NADP-dependent oxidoreductase [Pseudoalteromonas sp. MMG022]